MDYGASDTSTTSLGVNQFPIADVHVPNVGLKALGGGPKQTDGGGKDYAPALMYIQDGSDVAQGTTTDAANANTVIGQLKQIKTNTASVVIGSGTLTANIGTTGGLALDTSINGVIVAQGSTTSGQKGALTQGAVTSSAPSYTTGQTSPLSLTTAGALRVDNSANTQPVSGTFWQATQPVSGTITIQALTGTALLADQTNSELRTSIYGKNVTAGDTAIATDASGNVGTNVIGALPAGANNIGKVNIQASGTALAADNTNELRVSAYVKKTVAGDTSLTLGQATMANSLPVAIASDQGAVPVSGTITANAGTGPFPVAGMVASGASNANNPVKVGGAFNTTQPTVTNGQVVDAQYSARGAALVATGTDTFNVTVSAALPTGSNVIGHVIADSGSTTAVTQATASNLNAQVQGAAASGAAQAGNPVKTGGVFNTTPPTVTNGQAVDVQMTARGSQIVATGVDTFSVTANAGTNLNTSLLALESGGHLANIDTHTPAQGSATSANSSPVVIASDQAAVASKRSTVAVYSLASAATTSSSNSGDLTVGPYTEISLDINTTAKTGTNPTIQFTYSRKGADGIYYALWQSTTINNVAANTISTSIGAGMAYNQSLGATGQLSWVIGGSATPGYTFSANISGK